MTRLILRTLRRTWGWLVLTALGMGGLLAYSLDARRGYSWVHVDLAPTVAAWKFNDADAESAVVRLDGKQLRSSPSRTWRCRPGTVQLELQLQNFQAWRTNLVLAKGATSTVNVVATPSPRTIIVTNLPAAAVATIAGQTNVTTTGAVAFPGAIVGRSYLLQVEAQGFRRKNVQVVVESPGGELLVAVPPLEPLRGTLRIELAPASSASRLADSLSLEREAEVQLDGEKIEATQPRTVLAGGHRLRVTHQNYLTAELNVTVAADETNRITVPLQPLPAELAVRVQPDVSWRLLNGAGQWLDLTNGVASFAPGAVALEVQAAGYVPQRTSYVFQANGRYTWSAALVRVGQQEYEHARRSIDRILTAETRSLLDDFAVTNWAELKAQVPRDEEPPPEILKEAQRLERLRTQLETLRSDAIRHSDAVRAADTALKTPGVRGMRALLADYESRWGQDRHWHRLNSEFVERAASYYEPQIDECLSRNQVAEARALLEQLATDTPNSPHMTRLSAKLAAAGEALECRKQLATVRALVSARRLQEARNEHNRCSAQYGRDGAGGEVGKVEQELDQAFLEYYGAALRPLLLKKQWKKAYSLVEKAGKEGASAKTVSQLRTLVQQSQENARRRGRPAVEVTF